MVGLGAFLFDFCFLISQKLIVKKNLTESKNELPIIYEYHLSYGLISLLLECNFLIILGKVFR